MQRKKLLEAIQNREPVSGLTHEFYRYPARFSPKFVREAIQIFTRPGDLVFDPFMGGGTTVVEAMALGRNVIGTDISSLAVFVAQSKSALVDGKDLQAVQEWASLILTKLNAHGTVVRDSAWSNYQRNISCKTTWPIRKLLEQALATVSILHSAAQQRFARCVLLRTAQWALDCRSAVPSATEFRTQFRKFLNEMVSASKEYAAAVSSAERSNGVRVAAHCLHRSAVGIEFDRSLTSLEHPPKLVLTSPPYPGVHVLYHRWQIKGRRETPAPFWIAGSLDGNGSSFYTFGDRKEESLNTYFEQARAAFSSVSEVSDSETTIVQMVAFSNAEQQLPRYLEMLEEIGLTERALGRFTNSADGRVWRSVPNRKWYANQKEQSGSASEVVLFHRKKANRRS